MDDCFKLKEENPRTKSNIFSKLTFFWMIKLLYKGTTKTLGLSDLYKNLKCHDSVKLADHLEENWEKEIQRAKLNNSKPSLFRALNATFFWRYMISGVAQFISFVILRPLQPVVLSYLIKLFLIDDKEMNEMYFYGSALCLMSLMVALTNQQLNYYNLSMGMEIRVATSSLIYRKLLKLSQQSLGETAIGQLINLLSNDVNRFDMVMVSLHFLWITPFQVTVVSYFMWSEVGISCLAGILSMILFTIPVQGYLGKLTSSIRLKVAQKTDTRVKIMSEVIAGMQVIKMYAWEKPFEKIVKLARKKEIKYLTQASYLRGVYSSCMVITERATLFLTVCCYVLLGHTITADKVFSLAQFFNFLQLSMAILYPLAISLGAETLVSIKRLQKFLVLEEKETVTILPSENNDIEVLKINASWVPSVPTLIDFNITIPEGCLCAIVGPVGSGKSSILQLLLGELKPTSGMIKFSGDISYASQKPWLFASTVRKNILFGEEYDKPYYKEVVKVCALQKDFEQFPERDKTIVGERGVSLSGGQRARINLARAIYRNADLYLLDDPLSAVDTHVGKHLFEKCIVRYLKGKTRILVTHQLQYLKKADLIIVLNQGQIEACGTYQELSKSKLDFTKLLAEANNEPLEIVPIEEIELAPFQRMVSICSTISLHSLHSATIDPPEIPQTNMEEMVEYKGSSLLEYFHSVGSKFLVFSLFSVLILGQLACSGNDYWVTFWTQQEDKRTLVKSSLAEKQTSIARIEVVDASNPEDSYTYVPNEVSGRNDPRFWTDSYLLDGHTYNILKTNISMYIYTALILTASVLTMSRSFYYFFVAMKASKHLHNKMFHCFLKTPMKFFDVNPSGRILNRFSKDMGAIDEILPRVLLEAVQIFLVMCGILAMVIVSNYYMTIIIVILGLVFLKLRAWYLKTARNIKLLEGIAKSPVFSHISSTLTGIPTVRATKAEGILKKQFDDHQNVHTSAWYLTIMCTVSFGLWLDLVCVFFVTCVTFSFILLSHFSEVSGSLVGLAISQSLILTGMLQYGMRQTAEVINQLTSVERVLEYTNLEAEVSVASSSKPTDKKLKSSWPSKGRIEFSKLVLRYDPNGAAVLNNLNFVFQQGEKIGIVGRTGAGKSSIITALFRLAPIEGSIIIDEVDTKSIPLETLRKKISIIPQEPVLFSATMRYNLDPFNEYKDADLWNALEEVQLKEATPTLDYMITEGGSNFSTGERQLICLARAILKNNKILVLDEATANVDPRTDSFIQTTIRTKFKSCTVLTIAHRLNTIMDSDRVLVMETGCMVEFDHPHILLQNTDGYFHSLVLETGASMADSLKDIAHTAFKAKNGDQ